MMTAEQLKNSILQLALQGNLIPQSSEDQPASMLLKIDQQKKKKNGRRRDVKQKEVEHIFKDENGEYIELKEGRKVSIQKRIPFDIPESWEWIHLGYVCDIARGGSPRPIKNYLTEEPDGINWIKIGDSDIGGKYINSTKEKIIPEGMKKSRYVQSGDFLLTNSMSFGRPYILNCNGCIHDGWLVLTGYKDVYDKDFLYHMLSSGFAFNQFCDVVSGAVVKNLNSDKVADAVFPLPPFAEQKRIVAKIEELMPLVEQYAVASTKLNTLNTTFSDMMKKSILQEAVQGKLVPQDPNDEPASVLLKKIAEEKKRLIKKGKIKKQKPLPEITEDEIPFDIPESWEWCYVGDLFDHNTGKAMNSSAKQVNKKGSMRKFITTSNLYWNRFDLSVVKEMFFSDDELSRCTATKKDILMCEGGAYFGRTAIWNYDYDICFQNHVHRLRSFVKIKEEFFYYLFYFYRTMGLMKAKGTAMPGLSSVALHGLVIPLPPLAEQERIVSKIEELLPLCNRLK